MKLKSENKHKPIVSCPFFLVVHGPSQPKHTLLMCNKLRLADVLEHSFLISQNLFSVWLLPVAEGLLLLLLLFRLGLLLSTMDVCVSMDTSVTRSMGKDNNSLIWFVLSLTRSLFPFEEVELEAVAVAVAAVRDIDWTKDIGDEVEASFDDRDCNKYKINSPV